MCSEPNLLNSEKKCGSSMVEYSDSEFHQCKQNVVHENDETASNINFSFAKCKTAHLNSSYINSNDGK